jgi:hypothetical protein
LRKEITILAVMLVCVLFLVPTEAQALTGVQANSGTKSSYFGEVHKSYDTGVYNPVWWYSSNGNFYTKGHLASLGVTKVLEYWFVIQIKPEDSSHKYLRLKTDSEFHYGLSASIGYANWEISYSLVDTSQQPLEEARSWYSEGDSVGWGQYKNNKHYYSPNEYYWLYEYMGFVTSSAYIFSPNEWYYVGIHITITMNGYSDVYRYSSQSGNAFLDVDSISWEFTDYYEQPP